MKIVYYRYADIAVVTSQLDNEIRVENDEGKPIKADVVIGNNYLVVSGTLRADSKPLTGDVSVIIDGVRHDLGKIVESSGTCTFIPHDNTARINALIKSVNSIYATLNQYAKRIKDLETSAYGVDILDLKTEDKK